MRILILKGKKKSTAHKRAAHYYAMLAGYHFCSLSYSGCLQDDRKYKVPTIWKLLDQFEKSLCA